MNLENRHRGVWRYPSAPYPNSDVIGGMQFCATMQLRTPLRVLTRHREIFTGLPKDPPLIARVQWEGTWVPKVRTLREIGIDMDEPGEGWMASSIGPIPADGGRYLKFLIAVRKIVESTNSVADRVERLKVEVSKPTWDDFSSLLHHRPADVVNYFFPQFLDLIPALSRISKEGLANLGLDNPAVLDCADDSTLLGIRGVGPKLLANIREACAKITSDRDGNRVDTVMR